MDIATILRTEAVKTVSAISSKKRLFHELGDLAAQVYGLKSAEVATALQERESLGPTGVGGGIALPHARLDGLPQVHGLFIRVEKPLDFESVDRQPVDLVFALLAPQDAGVEHLKALAVVSRTMRDPALCAKLRANSDPQTLHTLLTAQPRVQAA
ncbi:PTS lactose transporter subunit IIC [Silicimonas algicola]|uniref:Phosphotransferase IIA-like nitrogen-regulatory protein PtsN n=1 Tax=Silicimonas algicola TaxID=1826607 RepID=A0A316G748_9RHOB|nr:PTS sugar transporter subunit IIA [Silicimonas algicola]AZQ69387.1 PTS lactose transporter subunit IIC [Silicimonas algicola]PWK56452.1 phosphotransferase IIA-like nitrogen-regulatory protein PtsN [Silicimonas algicola]